jgi:hypothetical protein
MPRCQCELIVSRAVRACIIAEARRLHYPINVLLARRKTAVIPGISSADALALAVRCIRGAGTCGKLRGAFCSP